MGKTIEPETLYDVFWEGPVAWQKRSRLIKPNHVLYAIYGAHPLYGRDVLLYIGRSEKDIGERLGGHEWWVQGEVDLVTVRVASVGKFPGWASWEKIPRYPRAHARLAGQIELLLIHAHQPPYNNGKGS